MSQGTAEKEQQPYEVLINGRLYDCRDFKHPGGSILRFFSGSGDATEAFLEFHERLPKAKKLLQMLPNRVASQTGGADPKETARLEKLSRDFRKLHDDLRQEGHFKASYFRAIYLLTEVIIMHAIGLWILMNTKYWIPACIILGIAEGRCGWIEHECGHYSFFGISWLDKKIQEICYGLGDGMSAAWWRTQHNKHHAAPQKLRHDVDIETLPLVAFNRVVAKRVRKNKLARRWISWQAYLFAPVTTSLVALYWQLYLHPRHMIRRRCYTEMISVLCRWFCIIAICYHMQFTVLQSIGGYLFLQSFGAIYIFVQFSLSHSHLDVLSANEQIHWVEHASIYTMNISPHWMTNWWMGYLNFQIEHHLFPSMPQFRFAKIYPRIRAFFKENGLKYDSQPYFEALRMTFKNLKQVAAMFDEPPSQE
ncbi:putative delta-5 fatty acid desaturase [Trypanosoma theileri]|uniref:Putative delta-5 fatty acid desaturase n=1 Tax=Trypanosoma theileri TaxID=67003 RepID=A0A1X0NPK3_9TRYP|nr:putative delta-5 fatty acid desaturase [Trypanosoma theileri]ORC86636.1 putative delta-5 fatty acid desaturase [Trypanosoma theileri]